MKIKIVDNLTQSIRTKPIELVYCLQCSYNTVTKLPEWAHIKSPFFSNISQLTRVGKHVIGVDVYDVIVVHTIGSSTTTFWLGHWNDGIVNENES